MLTVELGLTGLIKLSMPTFPWYAILASVGATVTPGNSGSYAGQFGTGDAFTGSLTKFENAV